MVETSTQKDAEQCFHLRNRLCTAQNESVLNLMNIARPELKTHH